MGGAVEKFWFAAAQEFARRGHEVTQMSRKMPGAPPHEEIDGVHHVRVRGFNAPANLAYLKLLDLIYSLGVLRVLEPADVLVTNTFWLPLLERRRSRGKVYVHVARYPKGQLRFYGRAARLQTPSTPIADEIARQAPALAERVKVIPYAAPDVKQPPRASAERERILLFVGRVHPEKGVHYLLEAFVRNADGALRGWHVVVVGSAELRHGGGGESYLATLRQIAARASDRVVFRGPIYDSEALAREYENARVFVYPSVAEMGETFGLAALEAMAHGCATVVSQLGCFTDFIRDEDSGFVFDHRARDRAFALGEVLARIVADEARLASVAAAGLRQAQEFSMANVATRFLEDFESLTPHA